MVYWIGGAGYSNLSGMHAAGIEDFHLVIGSGSQPPADFIDQCNSLGASPIVNNANDAGGGGWGGNQSYYATMASSGVMAVGGETNCGSEDNGIMQDLIFMNSGGAEGSACIDVFSNTVCGDKAVVQGKGCASYLETYDVSGSTYTGWPGVQTAVAGAKAAGCKEIGLLAGTWSNGSSAQAYLDLISTMEGAGYTCAGIGVWGGFGTDMGAIYSEYSSWYDAWMAAYPPNKTTIKQRFVGGGPTPAPGPAPVPGPGPTGATIKVAVRQRVYQAGYD